MKLRSSSEKILPKKTVCLSTEKNGMCSYFLQTDYFERTLNKDTSGSTGDIIPDVGSDKSESKSNSFKLSMLICYKNEIECIRERPLLTNSHYRSRYPKMRYQARKHSGTNQDLRWLQNPTAFLDYTLLDLVEEVPAYWFSLCPVGGFYWKMTKYLGKTSYFCWSGFEVNEVLLWITEQHLDGRNKELLICFLTLQW